MKNSSKYKIAIIGLGYVGLPLAVEFGKKYDVVGFDVNQNRIAELKKGNDHTLEVERGELAEALLLEYSTEIEDIRDCNIYIVTVPTPIDQYKQPDLTPLIKASEMIGSVIKKGDIVIYESTVYLSVCFSFPHPLSISVSLSLSSLFLSLSLFILSLSVSHSDISMLCFHFFFISLTLYIFHALSSKQNLNSSSSS